ncbi:MAG: hypothetical protein SGPRY_008751, partial [Prymnesium sp.]
GRSLAPAAPPQLPEPHPRPSRSDRTPRQREGHSHRLCSPLPHLGRLHVRRQAGGAAAGPRTARARPREGEPHPFLVGPARRAQGCGDAILLLDLRAPLQRRQRARHPCPTPYLTRKRAMQLVRILVTYLTFQLLHHLNNILSFRLAGFDFDALPLQVFNPKEQARCSSRRGARVAFNFFFGRVTLTYACFNGAPPGDNPTACSTLPQLFERALFYCASFPLIAGFLCILPRKRGFWSIPGYMSMYIYLLHPFALFNPFVMKALFTLFSQMYEREVNVWSPATGGCAVAVLVPIALLVCLLLSTPLSRSLFWVLIEPPLEHLFSKHNRHPAEAALCEDAASRDQNKLAAPLQDSVRAGQASV